MNQTTLCQVQEDSESQGHSKHAKPDTWRKEISQMTELGALWLGKKSGAGRERKGQVQPSM